jgi:hypothetical protein
MKAMLIKRNTDDGVEFIKDDVPIGEIYEVDEKSIQSMLWGDLHTGKQTSRLSISVLTSYHKGSTGGNSKERPGWLPIELFNLEAD